MLKKVVTDEYPNTDINDIKQHLIQQHNQAQVQKHQFPTEVISLPSQGKVYSPDSLLSSGQIEMKYMTAKEEDILTSVNLIKQGLVIDKLFQSLIVTPIKYDDLIAGDKDAIMIAARILGYGKEYPVRVTCPKCREVETATVDLTTISDRQIPEHVEMQSHNEFKFTLPQSKREVTFKLLTHGDEIKLEKEMSVLKTKKDGVPPTMSLKLKFLIQSVDGLRDKSAIHNFVDNELFAADSRALRSYINQISPGVDLKFNYTCSSCGNVTEGVEFEVGTNFFWPDSRI
jgi:hypothetical protein